MVPRFCFLLMPLVLAQQDAGELLALQIKVPEDPQAPSLEAQQLVEESYALNASDYDDPEIRMLMEAEPADEEDVDSTTTEGPNECPVPEFPDDTAGGKRCGKCPAMDKTCCLLGNKSFREKAAAWKACGETPGCGFIMFFPGSKKYYLRRYTDPAYNKKNSGMVGYTYNCCPLPKRPPLEGGKACPKPPGVCLNENKPYDALTQAWEACNYIKDCDAILAWTNDKFYLRRATDPNIAGGQGYHFTCCTIPSSPDMGGKRCPGNGNCLNKNTPYDTIGEAWNVCGKTEECGSVYHQMRNDKFYLRRPNDPDMPIEQAVNPDTNETEDVLLGYAYTCTKGLGPVAELEPVDEEVA